MRVGMVTLFPDHIRPWAETSIIGRAQASQRVQIEFQNPRDYCYDRHAKVDDAPFGGEPGLLIKAEPVALAVEAFAMPAATVILTDPAAPPFRQSDAVALAQAPGLIFLCGHYEGIDDRVATYFSARRYRIGDYVLTSGELAAMVMADAITRHLPGVLGDPESLARDSFGDGVTLSAPNYTRPPVWRDLAVPEVLLSGDHAKIRAYRAQESARITQSSYEPSAP
ncbi:MAG: tRNA (guanosine(37)-N1)-methyltransferase TrmD [Fimbriimonadaceae bacterium]|nr:tRNA (guanosine(37)-N1)-methyltransferase TrmD [Fimbriimonadaceae bacterium]